MKQVIYIMRLLFSAAFLLVITGNAFGQVKIGANPSSINANSLLEMEQNPATGRYGMRLPRVALTSTISPAPFASHVNGMTVYDTVTAGSGATAVSPGVYYNDGTQWVKVANSGNSGMPTGVIMAYGASGSVAPNGWLLCDGSNVSRTIYADLFATIGTTYGAGDGSTTFTLPNANGVFLRGAGSQTIGGSTYTAPTQGTSQNDATKLPNAPFTTSTDGNHSHYSSYPTWWTAYAGGGGMGISSGAGSTWSGTTAAGDHTHSVTGGGDSETRPANIVVTYIIKY